MAIHFHEPLDTMNPSTLQNPPSWFSPDTGIYGSKFPSVQLPQDPFLDAVTAVFSYRHDGDVALVDSSSGFSISYAELHAMVKSMAAGLHHHMGVKQGDVVLLLLPNSVHFPVIFLGVLYLGAVITTMNPSSSFGEIKKQVVDCNVGFAFTSPENVEKLGTLGVSGIAVPEKFDFESMGIKYPKFFEVINGDFGSVPKPLIKQDDTAAIMHSSGTTGVSKGVLLTHKNFIASMELFVRFESLLYGYPASGNVYLAVLPMCHVYGLSLFVLGLLSLGSTIVVMRKFDASEAIRIIEKYKITHFPVVPPVLSGLTKSAQGVCANAFKSLKQVSCGAAPLSRRFIEDFVQTFPHVDLIQGYGMTESTAVGTRGFNTKEFRKYSSVGLLAPNMQAKVVDWSSGFFLPPGSCGELWIRGPGVMRGYLNNPEANRMTMVEDCWLRSGDIAYFDQDGFLYIVDRIKEIIKYNGFQISPADLEAVLVSHPGILDAAVTAAPHEECGDIPVAFVVRRPGTTATLTEEDVIGYVAAQVASYKKVRKVFFVNSIPKSPAGKILRRELKRILMASLSSKL